MGKLFRQDSFYCSDQENTGWLARNCSKVREPHNNMVVFNGYLSGLEQGLLQAIEILGPRRLAISP